MNNNATIENRKKQKDQNLSSQALIILAMGNLAAKPLQAVIETAGFQVKVVENYSLIMKHIQQYEPDVLVLDTRFQRYEYLSLCRWINQIFPAIQQLILLPTRDATQLSLALDYGADDCLVAPFCSADVLVRIQVLLRHHLHEQTTQRKYANIEIIPPARQVIINGRELQLTALEFDLIEALSQHPGTVISRQQLVQIVWGDNGGGDYRVVDSHICHLRKKIHDSGLPYALVQSVRGAGYIFQPEEVEMSMKALVPDK